MQGSRSVGSRRLVFLTSCLVWVMGILLILNWFTGILFYVDDSGVYHRGALFALQYLLSYIYVLAACGHALLGCFQKERISQRKLLWSLALFPIAPAAAGILQFIYPQLPVACMTLSFATLVLYQNWLDDMISMDPLTRLNNRKQLTHRYEHWQRHDDPTPLYLLLIDANKFKSINDTFGHIQGDAALVKIADALRLSCQDLPHRANIARYGGDEFVILVQEDDLGRIERLSEEINQILAELNHGAPYELSVSVGFSRAEKDMTLKTLIEKADAVLYDDKKRRS